MGFLSWAIIGLGVVTSILTKKEQTDARTKMKSEITKEVLKELSKKKDN